MHQIGHDLIFAFLFREMSFLPCRMMIRTGNRTAIRTREDAIFSYRTESRIPIRFAANRTGIRFRIDGSLIQFKTSPKGCFDRFLSISAPSEPKSAQNDTKCQYFLSLRLEKRAPPSL
jgi:hypothetical protein